MTCGCAVRPKVIRRPPQGPFRIGQNFASEVVDCAKAKDIKPLDFPYAEARRIYAKAVKASTYPAELPMSEAEFRSTLDPRVRHETPVLSLRSTLSPN